MSFVSPGFFACLLPAVGLFYCLPGRWRTAYLLLISYAMYCTWSPRYLALLAGGTLATHMLAARITRTSDDRQRHVLLVAGVATICAILTLFKLDAAYGTALRALLSTHAHLTLPEVFMPLGLSFYSFRLLSYLIEVYWDSTAHEPSLTRFATYVAFFPQIVSGPIQRVHEFLPQLEKPAFFAYDGERIEHGAWLILCGLFQKLVIADRLALFVAETDAHPEGYTRLVLVLGSYAYTLQIFADFAGFTSLVIGVGELFGIESPPNFNHPFAAANIQDFWRRWHMSLTRWLGDYVFTPLRMRLRGWGNRGLVVSIFVNMILIGLWHGISSAYLAFGVIHGVFMAVSALTLRKRDRWFAKLPALRRPRLLVGAFVTFNMVVLAQIFFRAPTFGDGWRQLRLIVHPQDPGATLLSADLSLPSLACALVALLLGTGLLSAGCKRLAGDAAVIPNWLACALMLLAVVLLQSSSGGQFIYFKF